MGASSEQAAEELQGMLSSVSTVDLIQELLTREGISGYVVGDEEAYLIQKSTVEDQMRTVKVFENYHGPVRIITVVE